MLNVINGRIYVLNMLLWWGSDAKNVNATIEDNFNAISIGEDEIETLDIYSSLAYPFFRGSFEYRDKRRGSLFRNLIDMPVVYGRLQFCVPNGSDVPGSDNVLKPIEGESMLENIFVTGINMADDGISEYVKVKVDFVSVDYLKFISNLPHISTFEDYSRDKKPLKELLTEMFGAVGLGDKLDAESITIDVDIPYISSENDTLLGALDYVYRKIFDADFSRHEGKTYCRLIYDLTKRKYVLWKFDDVGTKKSVEVKVDNEELKMLQEHIGVAALVGPENFGLKSSALVKSSGSQSLLFESLDKLNFIDYNYVKNEFTPMSKDKNGESFISHDDEFSDKLKSKTKLVFGNAKMDKENSYTRTYSTSRQNASFYDVFTDIIFKSSFIRAQGDGSIGRTAGKQVVLTFDKSANTIYEQLDGDYLITAVHNHYEGGDEENRKFYSIMDLYRPYCTDDSAKSKFTF